MVNFMCQLDWTMECTDIWWNIILNVSVKAFFSEINSWICTIRQTALLMCMALIQSVEGLNTTKLLTFSQIRGNSACLIELKHWSFPAFGLRLKHQLFLSLKPASFPARTYTFCFPGLPACWLQILRFFRLHNDETVAYNKYLSIYIHTHTYTY